MQTLLLCADRLPSHARRNESAFVNWRLSSDKINGIIYVVCYNTQGNRTPIKGESYICAYTNAYRSMLDRYYYLEFGILFAQVLPFLPGPFVPSFLDGYTFPEKLGGGGSQRCRND